MVNSKTVIGKGDNENLDSVDALRGFAIALVVLVHSQMLVTVSDRSMGEIVSLGARGVQLFFIVSAFALYRSLLIRRSAGEVNLYPRYLLRRFFRIAPLFYIVMLFNLATLGFEPRYWAPEGLVWLDVVTTFFFMNAWSPTSITSIVDGGWSIAVEWNFYLILPLLLLVINTGLRSVMFVIVAGLGGYYLSRIGARVFIEGAEYPDIIVSFFGFWLPAQLIAFGFGILILFALKAAQNNFTRNSALVLLLTSLSVLIFFFVGKWYPLKVSALAAFAFFVIYLPSKLYVNVITVWLGRLSYSIYFVHFLLIRYTSDTVKLQLESLPQPYGFWVAYLGLLSLSGLLAYVTWRLVEIPGVRLGTAVADRLFPGYRKV